MKGIYFNISNKVYLVTGGSKGIGLEIAKNLLAQGAKVAICGRKQENLDRAVEFLQGGENVLAISAHIAEESDVNQLFQKCLGHFAQLDGLINNVGMNIITPGLADTDPGLWKRIIDSNLTGTFLCSRKAAAIMREQKYGKIVTISSIAARKASPGMGIYGIAKAGIEMMTKVLASELAPFNIQVNCIAPCMVRTEFSKLFWSNEELHQMIVKGIPMGRIAEPIDIVYPVMFLASDASQFITGQTIVVDGGATII